MSRREYLTASESFHRRNQMETHKRGVKRAPSQYAKAGRLTKAERKAKKKHGGIMGRIVMRSPY